MKPARLTILALLLFSIPMWPQSFKGHRMGERIQDFLNVEDKGEQGSACLDFLTAPDLQKRLRRDPTGNNAAMYSTCMALGDAFRTGDGTLFGKRLEGTFHESKLIRLKIDFWNFANTTRGFDFNSLMDDFKVKLGSPDRSWTDEMQNAFGARFSRRRAFWRSQDAYVYLFEIDSFDSNGSVTALIEDKLTADDNVRRLAEEHKNALDH